MFNHSMTPEEIPMPFRGTKPLHVTLNVDALDESIRFYTDGLKMTEQRRTISPTGQFMSAFMSYGTEVQGRHVSVELRKTLNSSNIDDDEQQVYDHPAWSTGSRLPRDIPLIHEAEWEDGDDPDIVRGEELGYRGIGINIENIVKERYDWLNAGGRVTLEPQEVEIVPSIVPDEPENQYRVWIMGEVKDPTGYNVSVLQRPSLTPLHRISLHVKQLHESIDFFTRVMGMRLLRKRSMLPHPAIQAWLSYGEGDEMDDPLIEIIAKYATKKLRQGRGFSHITFGVPSVDEAYSYVRERVNGTTDLSPVKIYQASIPCTSPSPSFALSSPSVGSSSSLSQPSFLQKAWRRMSGGEGVPQKTRPIRGFVMTDINGYRFFFVDLKAHEEMIREHSEGRQR